VAFVEWKTMSTSLALGNALATGTIDIEIVDRGP
jgi:hypothetical protein